MNVLIILSVIGCFSVTSISAAACFFGWKMFKETCYQYSAFEYNWRDAKRVCEGKDSRLAIIRNQEQQSFIAANMPYNFGEYWIGLSDKPKTNIWRWIDGSQLSGYSNWKHGELRNEECVKLSDKPSHGKWIPEECSRQLVSICEKPATRRCTPGWRQFYDICYSYSAFPFGWKDAKRKCEKKDSHLAIIKTHDQQKFITDNIPYLYGDFWIGLSDMLNRNNWQWVNGTRLSAFRNWKEGEPSNKKCAKMSDKNSSGKWSADDCSNRLDYICQKPAVHRLKPF